MSKTTGVTFEVLSVEPVRGAGRLLALAVVLIEIEGVMLTLQGVQVSRRDGVLHCCAPVFRHPRDGRWLPAVVLPDRLSKAIAADVLDLVRTSWHGAWTGL